MEKKPKYNVGQKITVNDADGTVVYEIKAIHRETVYPTGEHFQFIYIVEMSITLNSGYKIPASCSRYTEKSFDKQLKPEEKHFYSISVQ